MKYPDTSKLEERPLLPPDNYIIKLDEILETNKEGEHYADKKGREYIILKWRVKGQDEMFVVDFIYPDANPNETQDYGRLLRIREIVSALGAPLEGGDFTDLLGKVCRASVIIDSYKNKERNQITHYEPLEGGTETFTDGKDDDLPF